MLTRRRFLLSAAAAAAAALTACGQNLPSPQGQAPSPQGAPGFPRTVRHELGEARIEAQPRRVVCGTDGGELCSLLALGVRPVGFGQRNDPLRPWLRGLADDLDRYDLSGGETNYERLAAWQPDLLLVQNGFATPETMPRFSELAPTIATSFIDWRDNLRQVGDAVGLEQHAGTIETEKDAAVAATAARLPDSARGLVTRAVTAFPDGTVYVLNDASPMGKLASDLGLAALPAQATPGEAVDELSLEQLPVVDGDLLLLLQFGAHTDGDGNADLKSKEVFRRLGVVRAGRVVELTEDESQQLYFDSVLTVEPNAALLERVVRDAVA